MAKTTSNFPVHLKRLVDNAAEVARLSEIHKQVVGASPGRKYGVEVLNKSAIVLLVACWENFIEELATNAFDAMFKRAPTPQAFPNKVLALAGHALRNDSDETQIWKLSGSGWKDVLTAYRGDVLQRHVGKFNTPKPEQIDTLFESLIGLKRMSSTWSYSGMSAINASKKLERLVVLRGDIAHKVAAQSPVKKSQVIDYTHFIKRLAALCSNEAGRFVASRVGRKPWAVQMRYVGQKNEK
jgi:hypothetical protein